MFCLAAGNPIFDYQADVLNYLVQESLAHAALIFATLAAAFTFASGFKNTVRDREGKSTLWAYATILFLLFFVAFYALLRFSFYAALTDFLLARARTPVAGDNLTSYWNAVRYSAENNQSFLVTFSGLYNIGLTGLVIASSFAYLLALFTTLLADRSLSGAPRRSLYRIFALVAWYNAYLIIFDSLLIYPSLPPKLSISWWPTIFLVYWWVYADRRMDNPDYRYHFVKSLQWIDWVRIPCWNSFYRICLSKSFWFYVVCILVPFSLALSPWISLEALRNWPLEGLMSMLKFLSLLAGVPCALELREANSFIESKRKPVS